MLRFLILLIKLLIAGAVASATYYCLFNLLPFLLFICLIVFQVITLIAYGYDKYAAIKQYQRVSELALLSLSFIAWPIALFAQHLFHHKIKKTSFQVKFWFVGIVFYLTLLFFNPTLTEIIVY